MLCCSFAVRQQPYRRLCSLVASMCVHATAGHQTVSITSVRVHCWLAQLKNLLAVPPCSRLYEETAHLLEQKTGQRPLPNKLPTAYRPVQAAESGSVAVPCRVVWRSLPCTYLITLPGYCFAVSCIHSLCPSPSFPMAGSTLGRSEQRARTVHTLWMRSCRPPRPVLAPRTALTRQPPTSSKHCAARVWVWEPARAGAQGLLRAWRRRERRMGHDACSCACTIA